MDLDKIYLEDCLEGMKIRVLTALYVTCPTDA